MERSQRCFVYLNWIPVLTEPPSTGALDHDLMFDGFTLQKVVSFGSSAPPGVPTWSKSQLPSESTGTLAMTQAGITSVPLQAWPVDLIEPLAYAMVMVWPSLTLSVPLTVQRVLMTPPTLPAPLNICLV